MSHDRYTVTDVRNIFASFTELAALVGFDTRGWALEEGNSTYYRIYRHVRLGRSPGPETTEFRPELGSNAREAWQTLSARLDTLRAIRDLQGLRSPSQAGVELPPVAPVPARRGPRLP